MREQEKRVSYTGQSLKRLEDPRLVTGNGSFVADRIVRQRYDVQRLAPVPLKTRGLVAHYQPQEDLLTVWASTQGPHRVRRQLARLLDRPESLVRVIAPDNGGGFEEKGGASSPKMWPSRTSACRWESPSNGWRIARKTCWASIIVHKEDP